ncbi:hypothetical protein [Xanthobacter autotrophicus]|uniref:hypothetical protein n=1 Tax=Xanthobacter autotrophicus TaxID=280 RepID=UPI003727F332
MGRAGFFDLNDRYRWSSEWGDPQVKLFVMVGFEISGPRPNITSKHSDGSEGDRLRSGTVLMSGILILQVHYLVSVNVIDLQIHDCLLFIRRHRLGPEGAVPAAKTMWLVREQQRCTGALKDYFAGLDAWQWSACDLIISGHIVDTSIIITPRPRQGRGVIQTPLPAAVWSRPDNVIEQRRRRTTEGALSVEEDFGQPEYVIGLVVCTIGIALAMAKIGLNNPVYNVRRCLKPAERQFGLLRRPMEYIVDCLKPRGPPGKGIDKV